jgi:hypothetical protein
MTLAAGFAQFKQILFLPPGNAFDANNGAFKSCHDSSG